MKGEEKNEVVKETRGGRKGDTVRKYEDKQTASEKHWEKKEDKLGGRGGEGWSSTRTH